LECALHCRLVLQRTEDNQHLEKTELNSTRARGLRILNLFAGGLDLQPPTQLCLLGRAIDQRQMVAQEGNRGGTAGAAT
jgi:hypothetical protein